jgi:hypothetical protein
MNRCLSMASIALAVFLFPECACQRALPPRASHTYVLPCEEAPAYEAPSSGPVAPVEVHVSSDYSQYFDVITVCAAVDGRRIFKQHFRWDEQHHTSRREETILVSSSGPHTLSLELFLKGGFEIPNYEWVKGYAFEVKGRHEFQTTDVGGKLFARSLEVKSGPPEMLALERRPAIAWEEAFEAAAAVDPVGVEHPLASSDAGQ